MGVNSWTEQSPDSRRAEVWGASLQALLSSDGVSPEVLTGCGFSSAAAGLEPLWLWPFLDTVVTGSEMQLQSCWRRSVREWVLSLTQSETAKSRWCCRTPPFVSCLSSCLGRR